MGSVTSTSELQRRYNALIGFVWSREIMLVNEGVILLSGSEMPTDLAELRRT